MAWLSSVSSMVLPPILACPHAQNANPRSPAVTSFRILPPVPGAQPSRSLPGDGSPLSRGFRKVARQRRDNLSARRATAAQHDKAGRARAGRPVDVTRLLLLGRGDLLGHRGGQVFLLLL